jgi:hypothetical protein
VNRRTWFAFITGLFCAPKIKEVHHDRLRIYTDGNVGIGTPGKHEEDYRHPLTIDLDGTQQEINSLGEFQGW